MLDIHHRGSRSACISLVVLVLAACTEGGAGTGGGSNGAGGGGQGGGEGGGPASSSATGTGGGGTATSTGSGATTTSAVASTSTGAACTAELFDDPDLELCAQTSCCAEMEICAAREWPCIDPETGEFFSIFDATQLENCMIVAGCYGSSICESGLVFPDPTVGDFDLAHCLSEYCCEEFNDCTSDGTEVQACIACMEGEQDSYDLCAAANDCTWSRCHHWFFTYQVCDANFYVLGSELAECLSTNCCQEVTDCTGDSSEEDLEACNDCLNSEEGGPLCDAALLCLEGCYGAD